MGWTPDSRSILFWASGKIRRVELRNREVEAEGARLEGEWRDDDFPEIKRH